MGYRGEDLDLRTPQAAPGDHAQPQQADPFFVSQRTRPSAGATRSAPIWVDETVLDCCNHAFDVAAAHRANEVRIEHLIYALTRTEDAAEPFEIRGVRVAALRREAATVIATEIPAAPGNGKTVPRRAEALEEVLRLAAAHAYRKQSPVSVADVVYALFDSGVEFASLGRLLPGVFPRTLAAPMPEATLDVEAVRERVRSAAAVPPQPSRTISSDLASLAAAQAQTQQSRIDSLEQSVRALTSDLANERKILSGVLQDLQRELMAQREEATRLGGLTHEKIQTVFGDRLQSLEQAFLSARNPVSADFGPLQDRLGLLERALQAEISVTRAAVESLAAKQTVDLAPLLDRLEAIEEAALEEREHARTNEQALNASIQALTAGLERQPGEIANLVSPPIVEQLNAAAAARDAQHTAATDSLAEAHRRLGLLEEALNAHAARAENAESLAAQDRASLRDALARLSETIAQEVTNGHAAFTRLSEGFTQDLSELHDSLANINTNQHTLATTLDSQGQDAAVAVATLVARIQSLEQAAAKPVEMLHSLSTTVEKMHKVTVERYFRRNRFWYWLFGTDDWLAASWPSQSARIAEELRSIKN